MKASSAFVKAGRLGGKGPEIFQEIRLSFWYLRLADEKARCVICSRFAQLKCSLLLLQLKIRKKISIVLTLLETNVHRNVALNYQD